MQLSCKHDSNKLPQYFIQTRLKKKNYQVISRQFFSRKKMHINPQKIAPKSPPTFGLLWAPATMVHSVGGLDFDMRKLPLKKGAESRWRSLPLMQILLQNVKMVLMFAKDSIYKRDMWQSSRFRTNLQSFILPFSSNKWKVFHIRFFHHTNPSKTVAIDKRFPRLQQRSLLDVPKKAEYHRLFNFALGSGKAFGWKDGVDWIEYIGWNTPYVCWLVICVTTYLVWYVQTATIS